MNLFHRLATAPLLAACLVAAGAQAQTFKDPALEALYAADRLDELQRSSAQRLAASADDGQAVLGLALVALERDDAAARRQALRSAEGCVERQPRAAACQYALGVVLGVQAMSEGLLAAARSIGTVREALTAAHQLEPGWYAARSALMQFHVEAPAMMGGSTRQAAELARGAPTPEQARLLEARLALGDKKYDSALQLLSALPADLDTAQADDLRGWGVQLALALANAGQAAKAQAFAERLARQHPGHAGPVYALGRVRGELGAHEAALKDYESALGLKGAKAWPLHYRIGIEQQALGRTELARASYQRFIAGEKQRKELVEEARKRLAQLGA